MTWLLLTHAVALGLLWRHPYWWIQVDLKAIKADGAKDSLKQGFHGRRLLSRLGIVLALAAVASTPLWSTPRFWWSAAGLVAIGAAWFFYKFNPGLSIARGLDPYYLSKAPGAAYFPDRLLTRWGIGLKPVMRAILAAGLTSYAAALVALFLL